MISKAMVKFQSKFQFQILLHFYRRVEKDEICDGNTQKLLQGPLFFQLSYFVYDSPEKHDQQAFHCHTDNFGKLLRGSVTDPMLIIGFDSYFTSRSPGAWV